MSDRKRGRILPASGITAIHAKLHQRGWTRKTYADKVQLSQSTIARMLRGERVDYTTLVAALSVFGLDVDLCIRKQEKAELVPPVQMVATKVPTDTVISFYMDAIYPNNETNEAMIRRLVEVLQKHLIDSNVDFLDDDGRVTVVGVFTPEKQSDVEALLRQIDSLCTRMNVEPDFSVILKSLDTVEAIQPIGEQGVVSSSQ